MKNNSLYIAINRTCYKFKKNVEIVSQLVIEYKEIKAEGELKELKDEDLECLKISEIDLMQSVLNILAVKKSIESLEDELKDLDFIL